MKLSDTNATVTIERRSYSLLGTVQTVSGKCFDDGTHFRSLEFYTGGKRELRAALAEFVSGDSVVDCCDPECDVCLDE